MNTEQPKSGNRRNWPFFVAIALCIAVYASVQYTLKYNPSALVQRVEMCTADYKHAPTARDTAEIDALTPPGKGYLRMRQTFTCGYYRKAGATK